MISFLTTFKSFDIEPTGVQQHSAAWSWSHVGAPEVVVVGDDLGAKELCSHHKFTFVPKVKRGVNIGVKCTAPVLPSLIQVGLAAAKHPYICLINSDIVVAPNFLKALCSILKRTGTGTFLTGVRLDFTWLKAIMDKKSYDAMWADTRKFKRHPGGGTDFFVAHRDWWSSSLKCMKPWLMGLTWWDNWLHWLALQTAKPCIDTTCEIETLHPNHYYSHALRTNKLPDSAGIRKSVGAQYNSLLGQGTPIASIYTGGWFKLRDSKDKFWRKA